MADKPNYANLRVMVVDDEAFMRTLIIRILTEIGISDIITARDGAEGLEQLSTDGTPPAIIICDLEMPEMDGFEFVRQVRNHEWVAIQNTPILVVTGHAEPENVYEAVDAGIHGYLVKPISRQSLESRLSAALSSEPIDPTRVPR